MNANINFCYFHGRAEEEEGEINDRIRLFLEAGAEVKRNNGNDIDLDLDLDTDNFLTWLAFFECHDERHVLLVHLSPLTALRTWRNRTMLTGITLPLKKVYVVLVAGGGVTPNDIQPFIEIANQKFGGFDYFQPSVNANSVGLLKQMFERITVLFSIKLQPSFVEFSAAVRPDEHVATKIQRQFLRVFGGKCASIPPSKLKDSEKSFEAFLGKLDKAGLEALGNWSREFEELDAKRAQLRHGRLSNEVKNSIRAKSSVIKDTDEALSGSLSEDLNTLVIEGTLACDEANEIVDAWEKVGTDFSALGAAAPLKEFFEWTFCEDIFSSEAKSIRISSDQLKKELMAISNALKNAARDSIGTIDKDNISVLLKSAEVSCSSLISALELKG